MSKMSELDMDRQRVERLTDVVRPPSFAESARAGAYREITRGEINAFLLSAVNLAMAKPEYINGGVRVVNVALNADGIPRLDFDNGDFIFLDFEHLVPRDTVKTPAFYGAQCPSYPACTGGCGLGCTHNIEANRARNALSATEGN